MYLLMTDYNKGIVIQYGYNPDVHKADYSEEIRKMVDNIVFSFDGFTGKENSDTSSQTDGDGWIIAPSTYKDDFGDEVKSDAAIIGTQGVEAYYNKGSVSNGSLFAVVTEYVPAEFESSSSHVFFCGFT